MFHRFGSTVLKHFKLKFINYKVNKTNGKMGIKLRMIVGLAVSGATIALVSSEEATSKQIKIPIQSFKFCYSKKKNLIEAIEEAIYILNRKQEETSCPGLAIGVSVDGHPIWTAGLGYSDLENHVACKPEAVMRIASISKPLTATVVAKLWQEGKIDLDKPIQNYLSSYPEKTFNGKKVTITTRQLLSHFSGIRHYSKNPKDYRALKDKADKEKENQRIKEEKPGEKNKAENNKEKNKTNEDKHKRKNDKENASGNNNEERKKATGDAKYAEFFSKTNYKSVTSSLHLFKNDPLLSEPGTLYIYSTYGYTVLSAIVEAVTKEDFSLTLQRLFRDFGMNNTYLDEYEKLIPYRSRYYRKTKHLQNAPYVDNSNKWAGGGIVSNITDLLKFGNICLFCYQEHDLKDSVGYLKSETMKTMWTPTPGSESKSVNKSLYGLGWQIYPGSEEFSLGSGHRLCFGHSGGAVGASSILLILPRKIPSNKTMKAPQGIVVAILANCQSISFEKEALEIAKIFDNLDLSELSEKC